MLIKGVEEFSKDEFIALLEYIVDIEKSYGRIGNGTDYTNRIISEDVLNMIEEKCKDRFKQLEKDESLLDADKFYLVKTMWTYCNKEEYETEVYELP